MKISFLIFLAFTSLFSSCLKKDKQSKDEINFSFLYEYNWRSISPSTIVNNYFGVVPNKDTTVFSFTPSKFKFSTQQSVIASKIGDGPQTFRADQSTSFSEGDLEINPSESTITLKYYDTGIFDRWSKPDTDNQNERTYRERKFEILKLTSEVLVFGVSSTDASSTDIITHTFNSIPK